MGLRAAPEGLQQEGAPSDLVRSSDAPHVRPWPQYPDLLPLLPPTCPHLCPPACPAAAVSHSCCPPPPPPAHLLTPPLFSQRPRLELGPPQLQLCWVLVPCAPAVRVCNPPRGPALPQAAGRVPYGLLPPLVNEGPSVQVPSLSGALVASTWAPPPSFLHLNYLVFCGAHPPPSSAHLPSPCSCPARRGHIRRGPGLSAHQGALHLHTEAPLALGLGVAPE